MNFSTEQLEIINAPLDEKTIVMAAAAAGKTATLTERIRKVLKNGVSPNRIVAITFTNNAAAEMKERLGEDYKDGLFIGTIHSYANHLLNNNGYNTQRVRDEEEFDELFSMIEENPEVLKPIDYLLCDESQDLNSEQFLFVTTVLDPKAMLIVGDVRQSIYSFKGATPERMIGLMANPEFEVRQLTQNYRNGKKILAFSEKFLKNMKSLKRLRDLKTVEAMRDTEGLVAKLQYYQIPYIIKSKGDYKNWAVLCRTNQKVGKVCLMLQNYGIPTTSFRQAQGDLSSLKSNLSADAVKVLTIHSAKGLEFDRVVVCDLAKYGEENLRLNYVATTRARNELYVCITDK